MAEGLVSVHGVEFTRRDGVGERCELFRGEHSVKFLFPAQIAPKLPALL